MPGDPALPFENPILEQAVETWNGEWWKYGGSGTAWDAISYDPELNLVYIGVGNGTPWNRRLRSPVEAPNARYQEGEFASSPAAPGGHNWHPMAYHPGTGLVYTRPRTCLGSIRRWRNLSSARAQSIPARIPSLPPLSVTYSEGDRMEFYLYNSCA